VVPSPAAADDGVCAYEMGSTTCAQLLGSTCTADLCNSYSMGFEASIPSCTDSTVHDSGTCAAMGLMWHNLGSSGH
jgi:hypothetical protein